jgi:hypothetical protein
VTKSTGGVTSPLWAVMLLPMEDGCVKLGPVAKPLLKEPSFSSGQVADPLGPHSGKKLGRRCKWGGEFSQASKGGERTDTLISTGDASS